jgi:basic amino acid/polyamine antiporter, APA family
VNAPGAAPARQLGFAACFALVVGSMIGSGVFLLPASLAGFGWNAVAGWCVSIAGALTLAFTLAALARRFPDVGGPAGYVAAAFGPVAGFLVGWAFWVSMWVSNSALAAAAASYLSAFMPELAGYPTEAALAFVWAVTLVNVIGVKAAGRFQILTMTLKLLPLIVVACIMGLLLSREGTAVLAPFPDEGLSLAAVSTAGAISLFALLGFETVCGVSDRVIRPEVTIPRALVAGTLFVGAIYLVICSGIVLLMPAEQLAASNAPFKDFVQEHWARGPALLVALFAVISAVGAMNGFTMMQGELPLAMARRGMLPGWFAGTSGRGVPLPGLLLGSSLSTILVVSNGSSTLGGLFTAMALLTTSSALWFYLACAATAIRLRMMIPAAVAAAIFSAWTLVGAGFVAGALSLLLMLAGLPLYWRARYTAQRAPGVA